MMARFLLFHDMDVRSKHRIRTAVGLFPTGGSQNVSKNEKECGLERQQTLFNSTSRKGTTEAAKELEWALKKS
jgi:hypothetical protein